MTQEMKTNHLCRWMFTVFATGAALALSACHSEGARMQLEGNWVGTVEILDDLQFMRAEFARTWTGLSGTADLLGTGQLTLVRSNQTSNEVLFEMKRGDESFMFCGEIKNELMVGHLYRGHERMKFQLHRIMKLDRRVLQAYVGTYRVGADWVRSVEDCTPELGWDQLIYIDRESGGRKALFPISENTFFFGAGFDIPDPVQGTVTFINGTQGRPRYLLWDEAGSEVMVGTRIDSLEERRTKTIVSSRHSSRCKPFSG